jgi:hypothetical protein
MKRTAFPLLAMVLLACGSDPLEGLEPGTGPAVTNENMKFLEERVAPPWSYFRNSHALIVRAPSSPHREKQIRVRYNSFAATQLDADGLVKSGAVFPDSSIIVKELYDGTTLSTIAVMLKMKGSATAGFGGWVWAEYRADGTVTYATTGRGAACSSCHSRGIDYTRMNDSHP